MKKNDINKINLNVDSKLLTIVLAAYQEGIKTATDGTGDIHKLVEYYINDLFKVESTSYHE